MTEKMRTHLYRRGEERMQEILGNKAKEIIQNIETVHPEFADLLVEMAYGTLYTRGAIEDRFLEVAAVSSLISQGLFGPPLQSHFKGMMKAGMSRAEVGEILIFLINYVGFAKVVRSLEDFASIAPAEKK